jgi:hypothetical protein
MLAKRAQVIGYSRIELKQDKVDVRCVNLPNPSVRPHWNLPMPRYFFNTRIGDELVTDTDGELLRNPDRAWEVARDMIRELLRTEGPNAALLSAVIEVTDEEGDVVLEFPFSEAIFEMPDQSMTRH